MKWLKVYFRLKQMSKHIEDNEARFLNAKDCNKYGEEPGMNLKYWTESAASVGTNAS